MQIFFGSVNETIEKLQMRHRKKKNLPLFFLTNEFSKQPQSDLHPYLDMFLNNSLPCHTFMKWLKNIITLPRILILPSQQLN